MAYIAFSALCGWVLLLLLSLTLTIIAFSRFLFTNTHFFVVAVVLSLFFSTRFDLLQKSIVCVCLCDNKMQICIIAQASKAPTNQRMKKKIMFWNMENENKFMSTIPTAVQSTTKKFSSFSFQFIYFIGSKFFVWQCTCVLPQRANKWKKKSLVSARKPRGKLNCWIIINRRLLRNQIK